MKTILICTKCSSKLNIPATNAGIIKCPYCNNSMSVINGKLKTPEKAGFFSNFNSGSKQVEIEQLINETMRATFQWEKAGEKSSGDEMIKAANAITNNTSKIVQLYADLIKAHGSRNLYIKNKVLPAPMPAEISIQMAIMGIFQFAEALGSKNASFQGRLISQATTQQFTRIMAGR